MEFTQLRDAAMCTEILESHAWNVEAAVNTYLGAGDDAAHNRGEDTRQAEPSGGEQDAQQEPVPPRPDIANRGPARRAVEFAGVELPEYLAIPIAILRLMTSVLGFGLGVGSPSFPS